MRATQALSRVASSGPVGMPKVQLSSAPASARSGAIFRKVTYPVPASRSMQAAK